MACGNATKIINDFYNRLFNVYAYLPFSTGIILMRCVRSFLGGKNE